MLGPWMGGRFLIVGSFREGQWKRQMKARGAGPVLGQRSRAAAAVSGKVPSPSAGRRGASRARRE